MRALAAVALLAALAGGASAQMVFGGRRFVTQQGQNSDPPGSLSGHVVDAATGEPVRGATVNLQNYSRGGNFQSVTTDGAGAFAAAKLSPGDYLVQVTHPSYQGIMGLPNPSQMVTVASSRDSSGVTLRLMPGGTISGKVLDDGGEPVPGCMVSVLGPGQGASPAPLTQKGTASTNDKGEYKFDALTADQYLVYAHCQDSLPVERLLGESRPELIEPSESWLPVFYPDSSSPVGAQWLTVLPGSELTGIDFRLRATPVTTVSAMISGLAPAAPGIQPNIMLFPADYAAEASLAFGAAFETATSTFEFMMVPPGLYRLVVVSSGIQGEALAYASVSVTVGRVRPAPLLVQMHQGLSVSGVVELPPAAGGAGGGNPVILNSLQSPGQQTATLPGLGFISLFAASPNSFYNTRQVEVHHDGTFTLPALMSGRYRVIARIPSAQAFFVESVQFGSSQSTRSVFELAEGASGSLRVRMGAAPQVSANLADAPAGGQWVVFALPVDEPVLPFDQFMTGPAKSGDTVRMQNASAGRFAFVAVEMTMLGGMQNERLNQLLRDRVEPVEIVTGQDQTVSPNFFTSQEIEKLALAYLRGETR